MASKNYRIRCDVCVSDCGLGALLFWQGQWETLGKVKQEEEQLKEAFLVKKRQAINLDLIKKQLK